MAPSAHDETKPQAVRPWRSHPSGTHSSAALRAVTVRFYMPKFRSQAAFRALSSPATRLTRARAVTVA